MSENNKNVKIGKFNLIEKKFEKIVDWLIEELVNMKNKKHFK